MEHYILLLNSSHETCDIHTLGIDGAGSACVCVCACACACACACVCVCVCVCVQRITFF